MRWGVKLGQFRPRRPAAVATRAGEWEAAFTSTASVDGKTTDAVGSAENGDEGAVFLEPRLSRLLDRLTLTTRGRLAMHGQGDRRSPARGNSLQLVDFRPYTPGDDLRQIDWNVYGRSGDLFVRLYEDERVLTVHLLIDVSRSMDWGRPGKRAAALRLAAALGYIALNSSDRVVVGFLGDSVIGRAGPFWGPHQRAALFAALTNAPRATTTDFAASIGGYVDRVRTQPGGGPSLLVFISDLLSPTAEAGLRRLANGPRHECVVLQILAPDELDPEPSEDVQLIDRETGQTVELHLDLATLARYRRRLTEWTEGTASLCRERSARYLRISSDDDFEGSILRALRSGGIVR